MSQSAHGGGHDSGGGGAKEGSTRKDGTVLLRKSCDLCVRLKRACDGKSPCHLCLRRREICTRSVKRKSGPAKGTKYTTRRQRMEAGIADPSPARSKQGRPRAKHPAGGGGLGSAPGTSGASSAGGAPGSRGGGGGGGGGGLHNSTTFSIPLATVAPKSEQGSSPVDGRERYVAAHSASARDDDARARESVAADGGGGEPPHHDGASHVGGASDWLERHRSGVTSGAATGVVPRRSVSPLILPVLTWPSPAMAAVGPASGGGGSLEGEHRRGRSSSPFGLLPGPPTLVGNKPRRGGTREPPVEAGAGGGT